MFNLKYAVTLTCFIIALVIGLDVKTDSFPDFDSVGPNWWWNLRAGNGDQLRGDELYYPGPETMTRTKDGGYHYWWWYNILKSFNRGTVINTQQPVFPDTATTTTTTTTTVAPTTTPDNPPLPTNCRRTQTDSLGPFYEPFIPFPPRYEICPANMISASRVDVSGYVFKQQQQFSSNCNTLVPVPGAKIEIWQADLSSNGRGQYRSECTGYIMSDSRGFYSFTSSLPGLYSGRPRHIHFNVTTESNHRIPNVELVTQMYFESDSTGGKRPSLTVRDPVIAPNHRVAEFHFVV